MKAEHGGNIYAASRSLDSNGEAVWLDYSANINPLGLAPSVRLAMTKALDSVIHYPDVEAYALKQALSRVYYISPDLITVGNGAVELLYVLCHTLRPGKVLVMAPTFGEYERAACAAGAKVVYHFLPANQDFTVKSAALIDQMRAVQPDIVFLCNPNNPTGSLLKVADIVQIVEAAAAMKAIVVVDESFLDFLVLAEWTCQPLLSQYSNLIIAHSLTKFYAIPGLRLGFMLGNESITRKLHDGKDPWNVNSIAQAAGIAALADHSYAEQSRSYIAGEKSFFYQQLAKIRGFKPYEPAVNYLLVDISASGYTATELRQQLFEQRILIRDCSDYQGLGRYYIRLAVKSHQQNERILQVLKASVKGELL